MMALIIPSFHAWVQRLKARLFDLRPSSIGVVIALFLLWGAIYSIVTPIFEALDEVWHFAVVHHIVYHRSLPVQPADPAETGLWRQQGSQPPLYYLIGALLVSWIDMDDFPSLVSYNPYASGGHPEVLGNKNILLHWPNAERFPYRGTALAVHLLRGYSLALGAITLYGVYRIGRHIWPDDASLARLSAALIAFNPQFLFIHAGVINDALAITLSTWMLERLIWLIGEKEPLSRRRWGSWALLGLGIGAATLSKLSAALLLPLAGLALAWLGWQGRKWRQAGLCLLIIGLAALAVCGWWLVRNWQLYGDPTGLNRFIPVAGARTGEFSIWDFWNELPGLEISYWAVFGWFSIVGDPAIYIFFKALDRLAFLGLLWWGMKLARDRSLVPRATLAQLGLLTVWLMLLLAGLYRWTAKVMGTQGRLLFPGAAAVAIALVMGLVAWLPKRWQKAGLSLVATALALIALIAPFRYIAPAYRLPKIVANEDQVPISNRVHLQYGDWAELVGYAIEKPIVNPRSALSLTLYWRPLRPVSQAYSLYIHLRDADGMPLGQLDTYPGWGMYPTFLWQPGQIIVDRYLVPIHIAPQDPVVGRVEVGFCCSEGQLPVAVRDAEGRAVTPVIARFKIRGHRTGPISLAPSAPCFGGEIALASWIVEGGDGNAISLKPKEEIHLSLEWTPLRQPAADYTVFVHLVGDDLRPLSQSDHPPQEGRYPTSFWEVGERIHDKHTLRVPEALPPGDYHLLVGLYQQSDGRRLPVEGDGDFYTLPVVVRVEK